MAEVSEITVLSRLPVTIEIQPWFRDHCFAGKMILPAVETLAVLANEVTKFRPDIEISKMYEAHFAKFLEIGPADHELEVMVEIAEHDLGQITAKLLSKFHKKAISRIVEHGRVTFSSHRADLTPQADPTRFTLPQSAFKLSSQQVYRELVPFGKAYQNIIGDMYLFEQGAWARLMAPALPSTALGGGLGSPFPLDAAFHAACVWGQRYAGFIPFPVGFSSRTISEFTEPGATYETRVIPIEVKADELIFDLWIYTSQGELFETVCGIKMRDVSGGRLKPPTWIKCSQNAIL
nr:polyketide synthase dehydratase domain-containing protein [Desulfobulbaceae bacterium]